MHGEISSGATGSDSFRRMALVGGFLGAGKTTLIGKLSKWLENQGKRVALVTNDQGIGLMDTASAKLALGNDGLAAGANRVEEIAGGCFCCRLEDLVGAVQRLDSTVRPDVIVAEPVGSCTDLMATVMLPLEQIYQTPFILSPLSVVVDSRRALTALGGKPAARTFHRDVGYVFRKQVEEAEWIVVNKMDLLQESELQDLAARLAENYPDKRLFFVSAKTGTGLNDWFEAMMSTRSNPGETMEVDYERYAEGEALLGWVNSEAVCHPTREGDFDWGTWLFTTGKAIAAGLESENAEVGHFKMSLESGSSRWRLHQVISGEEPQLHEDKLANPSGGKATLLVNLRAEGGSGRLEAIVDEVLSAQTEVAVEFLTRAAFQPGKPQPTHRLTGTPA